MDIMPMMMNIPTKDLAEMVIRRGGGPVKLREHMFMEMIYRPMVQTHLSEGLGALHKEPGKEISCCIPGCHCDCAQTAWPGQGA